LQKGTKKTRGWRSALVVQPSTVIFFYFINKCIYIYIYIYMFFSPPKALGIIDGFKGPSKS